MASDDELVMGGLTIDGRERTFAIRLPKTSHDEPVPLVLALHGNAPTAGGWLLREWTTFDRQADAWGWPVAYPDGSQGCWADGRGVTTADEAGVDDVAFLRALIDWSADRHGTAPDRTVVAGVSNGAFMGHRLALEASDRVAVLGAVAGCMPADLSGHQPAHAVSALLIHGSADRRARIEGGHSRRLGPNGELRGRTLSLAETAGRWRAIDRCASGETYATEHSSRTTFEGGVGGTRVAAWTVIGGGHSWPGTATPPELGEPSTLEFDAAEEICRFAEPLLVPADARRL